MGSSGACPETCPDSIAFNRVAVRERPRSASVSNSDSARSARSRYWEGISDSLDASGARLRRRERDRECCDAARRAAGGGVELCGTLGTDAACLCPLGLRDFDSSRPWLVPSDIKSVVERRPAVDYHVRGASKDSRSVICSPIFGASHWSAKTLEREC